MNSIKNRYRYKQGLTNYYHRLKTLTNYQTIYRLTLHKKNRYYISALYETVNPGVPDIGHFYQQSRWVKSTVTGDTLRVNQKSACVFGMKIGQALNKFLDTHAAKRIVLDLGFFKAIKYQSFIAGVCKTLKPQYSPLMCTKPLVSALVDTPVTEYQYK